MKTAKTIIENGSFTELETKAIHSANEECKDNFGEFWSPMSTEGFASDLGITIPQAKGVIGSLVKKGVLGIDEEYGMIYFREQDEMIYEKL